MIGQHIDGKIMHKRTFSHFIESGFTSVLYCEFQFMPDSHNFGNCTGKYAENDKFFTQNHKENFRSHISRFTQMMRSEIEFTLDSRKFCLQPIIVHNFHFSLLKNISEIIHPRLPYIEPCKINLTSDNFLNTC